MQPVVRGAVAVAALAALDAMALPPAGEARGDEASGAGVLPSLCPPGTLPDGNVCIPYPTEPGGEALHADEGRHRDREGRVSTYEHIPRRPDRPADPSRYRYPVPPPAHGPFIVSGYDLHRPDAEQRRLATVDAVGHGGLDLAGERGTDVRVVALEHQVGDAQVLWTGRLFGDTVVTRHSLREGGRLRDTLVLHGHLDAIAPALTPGTTVAEGTVIGTMGDSGSPGVVHLHLEVRRVREGVDPTQLPANKLVDVAYTIAVDPRNVLPMAR